MVFIDAAAIAKKVCEIASGEDVKKIVADPMAVERAFFFIINRLAKQVRDSRKDVLMYRIFATGISGIPIIAKEEWKMPIIPTVYRLHMDPDSPLRGKINLADIRKLQRPIHLSTFVRTLQALFDDEGFKALRKKDMDEGKISDDVSARQLMYIKSFWSVVQELWKDAFSSPKEYLVLKAIGCYALNWLAADVFRWCRKNGIEVPSDSDIRKYLEPLKGFDWHRKTSPLAALGGMKGAKEAYITLLAALAVQGVKEVEEKLKSKELKLSDIEIEAFKLKASSALKTS